MKTLNIALLIFTVASFAAFCLFVVLKYGIQSSISASIHVLTGPFEKSLYSWFMLAVAIPMMIISGTALGWWAGALLAIDFAAVAGGDKFQNFLHCFGAEAGMTLGMLMLWVDFGLWYIVVPAGLIVLYMQWQKVKNRTWWTEVVVFAAAVIGLLIAKVL
jgi:hypothetical protein